MTKAIVVLEGEVAELFIRIKNSSTGLTVQNCDQEALETLKRLRLVRIQFGGEGRPDRVKLSAEVSTTDVRIRQGGAA